MTLRSIKSIPGLAPDGVRCYNLSTGKTMLTRKNFMIGAVMAGVAAFATGYGLRLASDRPTARKEASGGLSLGGDFSLVDHTGRAVTVADFKTPYLLIFFGYTFCPDVCPTELQRMNVLLDELGPLAARVQPIFISVDPERDTPEVLADYVGNFHPRLTGLTGSAAQLRAAAKKFGVYYGRVYQTPMPGEGDSSTDKEYLINHSALIFLTGADGRIRDIFQRDVRLEFLLERARRVIEDNK